MHIGAHKAATTHLQQALQGVRADLRKEGVRVFGPAQLRGKGKTLAERFSLPHVARPEKAGGDAGRDAVRRGSSCVDRRELCRRS